MAANLENLMARLEAKAAHPSLSGIEAQVWAHIASRQRELSPSTLWGWRSAAAALLLAVGLVIGGTASVHVSAEAAPFSTRVALAPSTLLGEAP